jgi:hypothetical protein
MPLLLGDGSGADFEEVSVSRPASAGFVSGIAIADLNADGIDDLVIGPETNGAGGVNVGVLLALGGRRFAAPRLFAVPDGAGMLRTGDVDGDGNASTTPPPMSAKVDQRGSTRRAPTIGGADVNAASGVRGGSSLGGATVSRSQVSGAGGRCAQEVPGPSLSTSAAMTCSLRLASARRCGFACVPSTSV